jgi:hypothetical protein
MVNKLNMQILKLEPKIRYHKKICKGTPAVSLADVRFAYSHSPVNLLAYPKIRAYRMLKTTLIFIIRSLLKFVLLQNMF